MPQHVKYQCKCAKPFCQFCEGGLFACTVCGGLACSLTTDCPVVRMTQQTADDVYAGKLDYRDGYGWVRPDGTGNSMGDMDIKYPRRKA